MRHIGEASGRPDHAYVGHTFGTLEEDRRSTRLSTDSEDAPMVLLLSRMHWKKGVDLLLDAARDLPGCICCWQVPGLISKNKALARAGCCKQGTPGWCNNRAGLLACRCLLSAVTL